MKCEIKAMKQALHAPVIRLRKRERRAHSTLFLCCRRGGAGGEWYETDHSRYGFSEMIFYQQDEIEMLLTGQLEMICLNVKSEEMDQTRVELQEWRQIILLPFFKNEKIVCFREREKKSWVWNIQEIEFFFQKWWVMKIFLKLKEKHFRTRVF